MELLRMKFLKVGQKFYIGKDYEVHNPQYMEFGEDFSAKARFRIEAIDKYDQQVFQPKISIGNNVKFLYDIHIGCINKITIGDNCLFASRIYISDHNHGDTTAEMLKITPVKRPIMSKGEIVIHENVWVGEGAAILGGVTIGKNSIIATNAVVNKDVPENSVVAGVPAKVIKTII